MPRQSQDSRSFPEPGPEPTDHREILQAMKITAVDVRLIDADFRNLIITRIRRELIVTRATFKTIAPRVANQNIVAVTANDILKA